MAFTVNPLKNGSYLVIHTTNIGEGYENEFSWTFQCKDREPTFNLHFTINGEDDEKMGADFDGEFDENSTITAWLEAVPNGELWLT